MRIRYYIAFGLVAIVLHSGCAGLKHTTETKPLAKSLIKSGLKRGMTQSEVIHFWGEPDEIQKTSSMAGGVSREIWTYEARVGGVSSLNTGPTTTTQRLTFDGDVLLSY